MEVRSHFIDSVYRYCHLRIDLSIHGIFWIWGVIERLTKFCAQSPMDTKKHWQRLL